MSSGEETTSATAIFSAIALFALGFVVVASVIHACMRHPLYLHADMRSEKLLMLEGLKGRVYSAAFGSSHVHDGFDPRAFDEAVAGSGAETRAVNLAILGGSQSEQRRMALEFVRGLTAPPAGEACLAILELNAGANLQNMHLVHPRSIDIYDWKTVQFISSLTDGEMSVTQRAGRVGFAVVASLLHYTNVGMVSNWIFAPPIDRKQLDAESTDDRRGLDARPAPGDGGAAFEQYIASQAGHFQVTQGKLYPGNGELVDELAKASAVSNVSFVYFVSPKLSDFTTAEDFPDHLVTAQGRTVPIVNLARPDRYPALYKPDLWFDEAHLDEQGAALLSRTLGDQLKAWYAAHGAPAQCGG